MTEGFPGMFAVIMAGGRGTRFWPVSRRDRPKQFLDLLGCGSLLSMTVERVLPMIPIERVIVVTGQEFGDTVVELVPGIPRENVMLEPAGRNTSACIGWAAMEIERRSGPGSMMVVLPSDHVIPDGARFRSSLSEAVQPARDGWLMTVGVRPDRPATGYGYLEAGQDMGGFSRVVRFMEKPSIDRAREFQSSGRHFWNAGIFVWRTDRILEEIGLHIPALLAGLEALPGHPSAIEYSALESVSIDYGVMEKADRVGMVPAGFRWDDAGDWPSARRAGASRGDVLLVDSSDCTVWTPGRLAVLVGMQGVSVVESDGVILVMADSGSQKLRDVVAGLESERPDLV